jgi:hypothetical protein
MGEEKRIIFDCIVSHCIGGGEGIDVVADEGMNQ